MERFEQPGKPASGMDSGRKTFEEKGASRWIPGGYYIKARCIEDSAVAHAPPQTREFWDYFLRKALFKDGTWMKRGEVSTSYADIREALFWRVGYRTERYSKSKCESAMKWLKKADMITTRRTTRGFIVTVCKYNKYQNPENYECHNETYRKTTGEPRPPDTTDKKDKKAKKEEPLSEGDEVHKTLVGSSQLRAMTYEQDMMVRKDFQETPRPLDWLALAQKTVGEAELMSEPIRNPAMFWRRQIQKHVDAEFYAKKTAASAYEDSQERLRKAFVM